MARKKKSTPNKKLFNKVTKEAPEPRPLNLSDEVLSFSIAILLFVLAVFLFVAPFSFAGVVGEWVYKGFHYLLGVGYYLLPVTAIVMAVSFFYKIERNFETMKLIGAGLFFLSALTIIDLLVGTAGVIGSLLGNVDLLFGKWMAVMIMFAVFLISLAIIFDAIPGLAYFRELRERKLAEKEAKKLAKEQGLEDEDEDDEEEEVAPVVAAVEKPKPEQKKLFGNKPAPAVVEPKKPEEDMLSAGINKTIKKAFSAPLDDRLPPLSLLSRDAGKPGVGDIKANANIIKRTLSNFGIEVEMDEVSVGPTVTRYSFKPAEGVKLSKIGALQDDLALALAAKTLRMETPIPGKSLVGVEIPNKTKTTVGLGTLLDNDFFRHGKDALPMAVGKDIAGNTAYINLAKAPHMLIAGATGAGKSVTVHALITSMLYKHGPEMLKFIMVDPKRVELTLYNGIPHLLTPTITDPKSAILALKWAVKEMNRRYDVLQDCKVRDIASYHENILAPAQQAAAKNPQAELPETMPYIVVVIDELADIMMSYPRELEAGIVSLAQMSRAVGIHLILSTQRPSVNVITGLIKANIPTRVALKVASQIDSRTILDMGGAEKLLGAGDMLYMTGSMSNPVRVQSAFIAEEEVKKVVSFLRKSYKDELPNEIDLSVASVSASNVLFEGSVDNFGEDDDELYEEAKETVIAAGKASTSYIQRKLKVGYSRAARLMDMLEERGVIGAADGSKPRDVIVGNGNAADDDDTVEDAILESGFESKDRF